MLNTKVKQWQCPSFTASAEERMGWIDAQIQDAESWQKGQAFYEDMPKAISLIAGDSAATGQQRSDLNTNHAKYALRKIVSTLADVREIATYGSEAAQFLKQAEMSSKVAKCIYLESHYPRKVRQALQWMAVGGTGYIWPKFVKESGGFGRGVFSFDPMSALDVLPTQLPSDNSIQGAYAVTMIQYMPVWEAHGKFPLFQESLLPFGRRRYNSTVSYRRQELWERLKFGDYNTAFDEQNCEIRYTFVHDLNINASDYEMPMGEEGTSWFYKVPYLGQKIPGGMNPDGTRSEREARPEDCLIYPQLRLLISSKGMKTPMYDGPAFDWASIIPAIPFCADDWPWEALGYSLAHGIYNTERARQEMERGIHQVAKARLAPGIAYDRGAGLNDTTANSIDPFDPDLRVGVDGEPSKVFTTMVPSELLNTPEWVVKFLERLDNSVLADLGLNDIQNLAEMKMNMNEQGMEKALALVGPVVKDIAYGMECAHGEVGQWLKFSIPQYLDTARVMQYVGPDGITPETLDFDPASLIPSHGPDEFLFGTQGKVMPEVSAYSKMERAKMYCRNLTLVSVPHTLHEITQTQERLLYLQLQRSGAPIAFVDIAPKLGIQNYGSVPGATMRERWLNEQKEMLQIKAAMQQFAQNLLPEPPQEKGQGPGGGQKKSGGRPPSGQQPAKIKQKGAHGGTPRTTVSESG